MPVRIPYEWSASSSKSSSRSNYGSDYCRSDSDHSQSTAPTEESRRPSLQQYDTNGNPYQTKSVEKPQYEYSKKHRQPTSVEVYPSSVSSVEDIDDEVPDFDLPDDGYDSVNPTALASSPEEFAEYFPSTHKLSIRHDDSTMDGNMNLRVDTLASTYNGGKIDLTLFHLRMYDLKRREFSVRRYCRDSGREVCHSTRKYTRPSVMTRPGIQRSMSNALSTFRSKSESKSPTLKHLKRHDSGYDSMPEDEAEEDEQDNFATRASNNLPIPTNTTLLEFSNYTHLEVKRRGTKASKRYEFEYWGTKYVWKRVAVRSGNFREVSYHLSDSKSSGPLAHIIPVPQSSAEVREEQAKGGWVPPCSMFFEESVLDKSNDLADIIVASGLIALADDCIKSRWHQKRHVQMTIPVLGKPSINMNKDNSSAKRLVDEVFSKGGKAVIRHAAPLRQLTS